MNQGQVSNQEPAKEATKVVARNVTMYPEQWQAVDGVDSQFDFRNTSISLRFIVDRYTKMVKGDLSILRATLWQAAKDNGYATVNELLADLI